MKQTLYLFLLLLIVACCSMPNRNKETNSVTVTFQLASKTEGEKATLIYPDYLKFGQVSLNPVTDSEGKWSVELPANRTLHIQIWDHNKILGVVWKELNLFCRPGTKAEILLDDINNRCIFSGENAEAHNAQIAHPLKIDNFHGRMFDMEMQAALSHIRNIHKNNMYKIDTLAAAHPDLPAGYVESLRQMARYGYAMDITQNLKGHYSDFLSQGNTTLPDEYLEILSEIKTEEFLYPQAPLPCDAYYYLRDVMGIEYIAQNGFIDPFPDGITDEKLYFFQEHCMAIDSLKSSEELSQLMKTGYFLSECGYEMTPEREKVLQNELTPETFATLMQYIDSVNSKYATFTDEQMEKIEATPIDSLIDGKEIFQKLIAPYRGRVVYVDVWGTWCGPCRSELEHLPQLHEELKDLPVTYMYLAKNSPEELWHKATKRFGLDGEDCVNLRLPASQQKAVEEFLEVRGFPTYILIAPDGSIADNKAPRPSMPSDVRQAIKKLYKK